MSTEQRRIGPSVSAAPHPNMLDLQFVLVMLVAEEVVLLMKELNGVAMLCDHLRVVLHLKPEELYHLLSVIQFQSQSLTFTLSIFKRGKML